MERIIVRRIKDNEIPLLEEFLYTAIFQREGEERLPRDVIYDPTLYVYIKDFGKEHDQCLVAEIEGRVVGAVWVRILAGEPKGFGNVDNVTPEFAISVLEDYRGMGIGKKLMVEMLKLLSDARYEKTSLAVQKDNYAAKLYRSVGFEIVEETDKEYIMVHNF